MVRGCHHMWRNIHFVHERRNDGWWRQPDSSRRGVRMAAGTLDTHVEYPTPLYPDIRLDTAAHHVAGNGKLKSNSATPTIEKYIQYIKQQTMTLVQHPATKVLSAILPSDLCRIICKFAAPHAAPTITTVYQLIRTEQEEKLGILAEGIRARAHIGENGEPVVVPLRDIQHIVEFSPNGRGLVRRQIRVSSSWARERERYGLGRRSRCLCQLLGGPINKVMFPCVWLVEEERLMLAAEGKKYYESYEKRVELGKGERCPYTYGPVSLRHLQRDATFRSAEGTIVGFEHSCEHDGGFSDRALFSIRRYRKWVWSTYDADRFTANVFI